MRRIGAIHLVFSIFLILGITAEAQARGFLDAVFGLERQGWPAQIYSPQDVAYSRSMTQRGGRRLDSQHRSAARAHRLVRDAAPRKHVAAPLKTRQRHIEMAAHAKTLSQSLSYARPCCANAQDAIKHIIDRDPTLRPGDAYMSHEGLRVYVGDQKKDSRFVPVDRARHIGAGLKQRLKEVIAIPLKTARAPEETARNQQPPLAHASRGAGKMVAGPAGRPIRLVGGFAK